VTIFVLVPAKGSLSDGFLTYRMQKEIKWWFFYLLYAKGNKSEVFFFNILYAKKQKWCFFYTCCMQTEYSDCFLPAVCKGNKVMGFYLLYAKKQKMFFFNLLYAMEIKWW
jgi:hypothetical protein